MIRNDRTGAIVEISDRNRILGNKLAETEFLDEDGITVIATLNLDNYGDPYELDVWKTDFSPLRHLPTFQSKM